MIFAIPADAAELPPGARGKSAAVPGTVAYLCTGMTCMGP